MKEEIYHFTPRNFSPNRIFWHQLRSFRESEECNSLRLPVETAIAAALDASYCEIITFLRPNLRLVAILDANNSLAIYLPDLKLKFIGIGKGYKHAKLQLDRLSNKRVMRL